MVKKLECMALWPLLCRKFLYFLKNVLRFVPARAKINKHMKKK